MCYNTDTNILMFKRKYEERRKCHIQILLNGFILDNRKEVQYTFIVCGSDIVKNITQKVKI